MQHPKESKGYSIPSRAFSGTVHAHEGYFCLFSHQTEACTFHPSWRRAVSLSLSHLRDRQHGMIWQDRVDALTQPGEELVEASFCVTARFNLFSTSSTWKPSWGWFKTLGLQLCRKVAAKSNRGYTYTPKLHLYPQWGCSLPWHSSFFFQREIPMGRQAQEPRGIVLPAHCPWPWPYKQSKHPMPSLPSSFSFVFLDLL